jgi:dolichyl-phosphate-mannose-protein mannosyltransferase
MKKGLSHFIDRFYVQLLVAIVFFAFAARLFGISQPENYMFDEVYHAVSAKAILHNQNLAFEWWNPPPEPHTAIDWLHPPLAKYTQALGMGIFGENSFGWRMSSVIFGTLVIGAIAVLAKEVFGSKLISLTAALLASFDGLLLVQSRIAMNDIHVTFFILLTLILYIRYRKSILAPVSAIAAKSSKFPRSTALLFLTGLSGGLALASKWSGLFVVLLVLFFEGIHVLSLLYYVACKRFASRKKTSFSVTRYFRLPILFPVSHFFFLVLLPIIVYVCSYGQMFAQGKTLVCLGNKENNGECYCSKDIPFWEKFLQDILRKEPMVYQGAYSASYCPFLISHFSELHNQIWRYQTTLTATHPYDARPIQWFLDLRPMYMYQGPSDPKNPDTVLNIYSFGNPALFWIGDVAVLGTLLYFLVRIQLNRIEDHESSIAETKGKVLHSEPSTSSKTPFFFHPVLFTLICYAMVWMPWFLSPRPMYFYHYTPAVPFLCMILAFWLSRLWEYKYGKFIFWGVLIVVGITFAVWYPNWTGLPVSKDFAEKVYFAIKSWR